MRYRADIEGLRAVAIVPVILFHYNFGRFASGGFVGVDIFFVISGYLITSMIRQEMLDGRFSLPGFYARRVRRLFPALFVLILCCLIFAALFCVPPDVTRLGRSAVDSVLFVANIHDSRLGYFNSGARFEPLLHIWSLSVEEQFYLLFPVLLLIVGRSGRRIGVAVMAVATASFIVSVVMGVRAPYAGFFLLQSRAWELLLGALLALGIVPTIPRKGAAELLAGLGLALIVFSVVTFDEHVTFPGANALVPCLGAACVIHAGARGVTLVGAVLSLRPIRFVGAISYSLYLWHWPVLVFYRLLADEPQSHAVRLALIAVSVGAAILSWRYVEEPFRRASLRLSPVRWLGAAAAAIAAIALVATGAGPATAARWTGSRQALAVFPYLDHRPSLPRIGVCFLTGTDGGFAAFRPDVCLAMDRARPNVLLVGDSHAAHLWSGLAEANPGINFLEATGGGCRPFQPDTVTDLCGELMDRVYRAFLPGHPLDGIILAANWRSDDLPQLLATVARLRRSVPEVTVIGPIVEYDTPLPRLLVKSATASDPGLVARHRRAGQPVLDAALATALAGSGATYVSLYRMLCPDGDCIVWAAPDVPLQIDSNHLSVEGSRLVADRMGPILPGGTRRSDVRGD